MAMELNPEETDGVTRNTDDKETNDDPESISTALSMNTALYGV